MEPSELGEHRRGAAGRVAGVVRVGVVREAGVASVRRHFCARNPRVVERARRARPQRRRPRSRGVVARREPLRPRRDAVRARRTRSREDPGVSAAARDSEARRRPRARRGSRSPPPPADSGDDALAGVAGGGGEAAPLVAAALPGVDRAAAAPPFVDAVSDQASDSGDADECPPSRRIAAAEVFAATRRGAGV